MLRRSIPNVFVVDAGVGLTTEDRFAIDDELFDTVEVSWAGTALDELPILALLDSEYHFLSMYFILMNSFNLTMSLPLGLDSLSLYFAKYFALKAVLPTLASIATSISVNTLIEMPFTLNWKSRLIMNW